MSIEYYTPQKYVDAVREVLGDIDLDPASCKVANETVKATTYYPKEVNGLALPWFGKVYLNPPYGNRCWTDKLNAEYLSGNIDAAILCHNANTATGSQWFDKMWNYPMCFPGRIRFLDTHGRPEPSPPNGTVFVYLGKQLEKFRAVFSKLGPVVIPA